MFFSFLFEYKQLVYSWEQSIFSLQTSLSNSTWVNQYLSLSETQLNNWLLEVIT